MSDHSTLFAEIDQETWLLKVQKELKGKSHHELIWDINDRISIDPLLSKERSLSFPVDLPSKWIFGEKIVVQEATTANKMILSALRQGIQALQLHITKIVDWNLLFKDVELSYIDVALITNDTSVAETSIVDTRIVDALDSSDLVQSTSNLSDPPEIWSSTIPKIIDHDRSQWRIVESTNSGDNNADISLANLFYQLVQEFDQKSDADIIKSLAKLNIELQVGRSFYLAIAKVRATRILLHQLIQSLHLKEITLPKITTHIDTSEWTDDIHKNLITCTTQAMSSILGGADVVIIPSADTSAGSNQGRYRRMARNIHQILALESQLQNWDDPVKGSYYLETLSYKIAESAWNLLQQKVADKG